MPDFSNGGLDTFDLTDRYVGLRLKMGVPLLDRDWNEAEDIRRHVDRMLRLHNLGDGVPDDEGLAVTAPPFPADDEVLVGAGRCSVDGHDVWNPSPLLFSEQGDRVPLPGCRDDRETEEVVVFLEARVERVRGTEDPRLLNEQDVGIETSLRDRLVPVVRAVRLPDLPPPGTHVLARVVRRRGEPRVGPQDVVDARRTGLNLAATVDAARAALRRLDAVEADLVAARAALGTLQHDVNRLFWEVTAVPSATEVLFGGKARMTVSVHDRNGTAVSGVHLALSTDYGHLSAGSVSTDARGQAGFELTGIETAVPVRPADLGLLSQIATKVELARQPNPGSIRYAAVQLLPQEMALVSRYSPAGALAELGSDIPSLQLVERPPVRTATVTIHAMDGPGGVVRGVGSVQVRFGQWLRDWVRTKLFDVVGKVRVAARVGAAVRDGFDAQQVFDSGRVQGRLPQLFQDITDDTTRELKTSLFDDPSLDDDALRGSGAVAQVIAQEATAAIGANATLALTGQIRAYAADPAVPSFGAAEAKTAQTVLVQATSQIAAGLAQGQKQLFARPRAGL